MTNRDPRVWGFGLFVVALLIRLIGIGWGLPNENRWQSLHPDEPLNLVVAQQIEPAQLDFDPNFYNYPTLYLTALRVATQMTAAYTGSGNPESEKDQWALLGRATLGGRILTALAGAGTSLAVFLMLLAGFRARPEFLDENGNLRGAAVLGALGGGGALAVAPAFTLHSRFATVDVPSTFFLAMALWVSVRIAVATEGVPLGRMAILAGVFAGLAAGTKYNAGLVLLSVLAAPWFSRKSDAPKVNGISLAACALTFLITTPGVLTNTAAFLRDFRYELEHTSSGHGLVFVGTSPGFVYHLQNLFTGYGLLLLLVSLAGLVYAVRAKSPLAWIVLLTVVPYYLLIGRAEVKFMRYTFPLMVGAAAGFGYLMGEARRRGGKNHAWVAAGILGLGGLDPGGLRGAATVAAWMANEDPRDAAGRYLRENAESVGLVSDPWFYSPTVFPQANLPRAAGFPRLTAAMQSQEKPRVERYLPPNPDERGTWDLRLLEETRPQFVVISSFEERDLARIAKMNPIPEPFRGEVDNAQRFMKRLEEDYTLDRQYGMGTGQVEDVEYVQPVLTVWKRKEG